MKRYDDDLLFVAHPTPTVKLTVTSLERTVTLIRARLAGIGVRNAGIVRDETKIRISLPDGLAKPAARRVVGAPGRLAFYDWEKSVLGPDGSRIRSTSRSRAASRPASPATARRATTWRSSAPRGSGHRQAHQRVGLRRRRSREVRPRGPQATKADARELAGTPARSRRASSAGPHRRAGPGRRHRQGVAGRRFGRVRHPRRPGLARPRHREPQADRRQRDRPARRLVRLHRRGPQEVAGPHADRRSARNRPVAAGRCPGGRSPTTSRSSSTPS